MQMTAQELRELIDATGLDQQEVASALDTSNANITYYLKGRHAIPDSFADRARPYLVGKAKERKAGIGKVLAKYP